MQYNDVVTFFHEFGHLMHAILGGRQAMGGREWVLPPKGTSLKCPRKCWEEFFHDAKIAGVVRTPLPDRLNLSQRRWSSKMNRASAFGRADGVRTQLFYTSYSLDVHNLSPHDLDLDALLEEGYKRMLPL